MGGVWARGSVGDAGVCGLRLWCGWGHGVRSVAGQGVTAGLSRRDARRVVVGDVEERGVGRGGRRWYEWRCGWGIGSEALRGGLSDSRNA